MNELLRPIVAKNADGSFAEPDARVRAAAQRRHRRTRCDPARSRIVGHAVRRAVARQRAAARRARPCDHLRPDGRHQHGARRILMIGAYATYVVQKLVPALAPGAFDWYPLLALPVAFLRRGAVGMVLERTRDPLPVRPAARNAARHLRHQPDPDPSHAHRVRRAERASGESRVDDRRHHASCRTWSCRITASPSSRSRWSSSRIAWAVLNNTRLGLFVRAVTQNRAMAACVGVHTARVDIVWRSGWAPASPAWAACALSQIGNVGPDLGQSYIVDSFMVVVLGGVGQLAGTVIGGSASGSSASSLEPFCGRGAREDRGAGADHAVHPEASAGHVRPEGPQRGGLR